MGVSGGLLIDGPLTESQETEAVENWSLKGDLLQWELVGGDQASSSLSPGRSPRPSRDPSPSSLLDGRDGHPAAVRGGGVWCCLGSKTGRGPHVQEGTLQSKGPLEIGLDCSHRKCHSGLGVAKLGSD